MAELQRWMADMPSVFAGGFSGDSPVNVEAVIADLFESAYGVPPSSALRRIGSAATEDPSASRHARWILAACHLLWHPELRSGVERASDAERFLLSELADVAKVADVEALLGDEERAEELIRRALRALGRRLPGESEQEAVDRLAQVDVVERHRVLRQAEARAARAREVRAAMRRKAAEEAAAKICRE